MTARRGRRGPVLVAAAVVIAAGCGGGASAPAGVEPTLQIETEPGVGPVLADPEGAPLYLFTRDAQRTPTCGGPCTQTWPPLVVPDGATAQAGPGVRAGLIATVASPGGGRQITYDRWPLYTYARDQTTFSARGNGVAGAGGTFWAVRADGTAARP